MQSFHKKLTACLCAGLVALISIPTFAYTLTTFGPSTYSANTTAMDAVLGITGMSIESFSDSVLIPRLSVTFQNPNAGPFTTLPTAPFVSSVQTWDGSPSLINRPNQDNTTPYASTTFEVNGGTSRFGVGLADFEAAKWNQTELLINGTSLGLVSNLPNYADAYVGGNGSLNLYLLISVAPGDSLITSVKFNMLATLDAQLFDHVAIDASPVPTSPTDCLLNWAETNYVSLFSPAGAATQTLPPYTYRYYKNTNAYVGVSSANNDVYYLGPDGNLLDVGALSGWLTTAHCQ